MPRKCAIGTVKKTTASGRSRSTSRSRWRRQRGVTTRQIVSRVRRSKALLLRRVLAAPQVAVALQAREAVAQRRRTTRPRGTSGSARCATRATRPAGPGTASRRGRRPPRTSPSTAATTPACSRSGSRGRRPRRRRGSWAPSRCKCRVRPGRHPVAAACPSDPADVEPLSRRRGRRSRRGSSWR